MKTSDLPQNVVEKAYARWAPIYDAVCGPVMVKGRRAAAAAARAIGGRILEVGVGTGLSFDDYDETTEITGIDLSAPMLARAREKMASGRYPYVRDVQRMDATICHSPTPRSIAWWRSSSSRWWPTPSRCCPNATAW